MEQRDGSVIEAGQYIDMWYEYVPEEVLDGTAAEGSIPLIRSARLYPRVFVEEFGLLELAGQERIALVAPEHQYVGEIRGPVLTAIVEYMLETYPALDASRVYATGYSMGSMATHTVANYSPKTFAAIAPIAGGSSGKTEEQLAVFETCDLPTIIGNSSYDTLAGVEGAGGNLNEKQQSSIIEWAAANEIDTTIDFDAYPYVGIGAGSYVEATVNDEFDIVVGTLDNEEGVPMVSAYYIKGMIHALYPEFARINWEFMSNYSRDLETGEIIYNPYN